MNEKEKMEVAVNVSVKIMCTFVEMRRFYDAFSLLTHLVSMSLLVNYTNMFHDRFLIIDETLAYHIGASLKDAGKKCFAINRIEDRIIVEGLLNRLYPKEGGE